MKFTMFKYHDFYMLIPYSSDSRKSHPIHTWIDDADFRGKVDIRLITISPAYNMNPSSPGLRENHPPSNSK